MAYHKNTIATFKPFDARIAEHLITFANRKRNIGRSVRIAGKVYQLDHISRSSSSYFCTRGLSIYYRVDRSVVRISDHWSETNHNPRSRKFNCGRISSCLWKLKNRKTDMIETHLHGAGKYPHRMLAGICGLNGFKTWWLNK